MINVNQVIVYPKLCRVWMQPTRFGSKGQKTGIVCLVVSGNFLHDIFFCTFFNALSLYKQLLKKLFQKSEKFFFWKKSIFGLFGYGQFGPLRWGVNFRSDANFLATYLKIDLDYEFDIEIKIWGIAVPTFGRF
jgi:hypothetical protein